jgi:predicted nuclease of restriction endonuclease-like RecB superfamily
MKPINIFPDIETMQKGISEKDYAKPYSGPIPIEMNNGKLLRNSVETKNPREDSVKFALMNLGIPSYYELMQFPLSNGKAYYPDFITSIFFNGRQVILEPHGSVDYSYMKKLNEFIVEYHFYVVLISNKPPPKLKAAGANPEDFIDEYWFIKGFYNTENEIKYNTKKVEKNIKKLLRKPNVEIAPSPL